MPAKRFCTLFFSITAAAFVGIAMLNFLVDPYAQYSPEMLRPLVQTSRAEKVALFRKLPAPPEGLILGSSRVLKFEPDYLHEKTGLRFFNAGVNYAKSEDHLALVRYFENEHHVRPRMIVLGLDLSSFSDGNPIDARLLSDPCLSPQLKDVVPLEQRVHRWKELLSWQQTKNSIKSIKLAVTQSYPQQDAESFRPDGLLVYHEREAQLSQGTYDFDAALAYNQNEYQQLYRGFDRLSLLRCRRFERLAEHCRQQQIALYVFLTPMHPELLEYIRDCSTFDQRRTQMVRYLEIAAERYGYSFVDFSDIRSFQGSPELFVDGIHPLEPNTRRMIDILVQTGPKKHQYAVQ
ncbi:MAG: SGNH/GDSL hydrolase family protein [Pirellulaceae bacterium]